MNTLKKVTHSLLIRPLIMMILGLVILGKENLKIEETSIIAANHNSHLDTLTLLSLIPLAKIDQVRPVAAADYFLSNRVLAWLSLNIIGILPIDRQRKDKAGDPLGDMCAALEDGQSLILFPEGSRGKPEELGKFKTGIARLVERHPEVPIIPVFTHGLGKSLPRGDFLLVPFFAEIAVGEPIFWRGSVEQTMQAYQQAMEQLATQLNVPAWT